MLDEHQQRAASAVGHCVVLACPGSGKTTLLAAKATRLLSDNKQGRLAAVTFTRDSAAEVRSRILNACGDGEKSRLAVGTFHSLAYALLSRNTHGRSKPRVLTDSERMAVLRRCRDLHASRVSLEDAVMSIDAIKARVSAVIPNEQVDAMFGCYKKALANDGAMDFADIMRECVHRIRSGSLRIMPVRWLLVDEAQDMDEVQLEWVLLHARAGIDVTLVGDDDQSLYAFRHALGYEGLMRARDDLSAMAVHLPVNYRCPANIVDHAGRLIAHNQNRAPKQFQSARADHGKIAVIAADNRWSEAVAACIAIASGGDSWAVLARTNAILDYAEAALASRNIDYVRSGGRGIWDHTISSVFLGLLRSLMDGSWIGVANTLSACGLSAGQVNQAEALGKDTASRLSAAADRIDHEVVVEIAKAFAAWRAQLERGRVSLVVYGVGQFLADRMPARKALIDVLAKCVGEMRGTLAHRINMTRLRSTAQRSSSKVTLATLHAAKGLEFDHVWITGCEDGVLPHVDGEIEEERRLMYVGMTRVKSSLQLSWARSEGMVSRFVAEAGVDIHGQP